MTEQVLRTDAAYDYIVSRLGAFSPSRENFRNVAQWVDAPPYFMIGNRRAFNQSDLEKWCGKRLDGTGGSGWKRRPPGSAKPQAASKARGRG